MGPSGMSGKGAGWLVPSVQKMQTRALHDYALLLQIFISQKKGFGFAWLSS